jgi:hypothetical protein
VESNPPRHWPRVEGSICRVVIQTKKCTIPQWRRQRETRVHAAVDTKEMQFHRRSLLQEVTDFS